MSNNPHWTQNQITTDDIGNPGPGLEKANKCGGVNPSTLDSCISNGNTHINVKKTSLTPPFFIEVPVPRQESERSCICVFEISILSLSTTLIFEFWNCLDSGICFHFINKHISRCNIGFSNLTPSVVNQRLAFRR